MFSFVQLDPKYGPSLLLKTLILSNFDPSLWARPTPGGHDFPNFEFTLPEDVSIQVSAFLVKWCNVHITCACFVHVFCACFLCMFS